MGGTHRTAIPLAESFPPLTFKLNFAFVSIGYFTELNILLSIWVFILISTIQVGIMSRIGVPRTNEIVLTQHLGGFLMYTLFGLWMARRHLLDVARKAIGRGSDVDDSMEFFSYRTAVLGVLGGLVYMAFFLFSAGMSPVTIGILLTTTLLLNIGVARVVWAYFSPIVWMLYGFPTTVTSWKYGDAGLSDLSLMKRK